MNSLPITHVADEDLALKAAVEAELADLNRKELAEFLGVKPGAEDHWIAAIPIRVTGTRPDALGRPQPIYSREDAGVAKARRAASRKQPRHVPLWKSHSKNFTSREAAKEIGISTAKVNKLVADGTITSEGEWYGYTRERFPLLKRDDVLKQKSDRIALLAQRTTAVPKGYTLIENGVANYGFSESFIKTKVFHEWDTASQKLPSKKGVILRRVLVQEKDLLAISTERRRIRRAWRGKLTISEFAQRTDETSDTVYCWLSRDWCTILNRKLIAEQIPGIVQRNGNKATTEEARTLGHISMSFCGGLDRCRSGLLSFAGGRQADRLDELLVIGELAVTEDELKPCGPSAERAAVKKSHDLLIEDAWAIEETEADLICAVKLTWICAKQLARDLGIRESTVKRWCKDGMIHPHGLKLSFDTCRKMGNVHSPPSWHVHRAVGIKLAEHYHRYEISATYIERLSREFGKGKKAKTAEELAKRALDHCKPDDPATKPADAPPAGDPGGNGNGQQKHTQALTMGVVAKVHPLDDQEFMVEKAVIHINHGEVHLPAPSTHAPANPTPGYLGLIVDEARGEVRRARDTYEHFVVYFEPDSAQ